MVPRPLLSRPKLQVRDLPYHEAFSALNQSRQGGMSGHEPIPISEALAYLTLVGIASIEARAKYLRLIQRMDSTYRAYCAEKAPKT